MENANSILVGNNDRDSTKCRTVPQGLLPTTTAESPSKKRIAVPASASAKGKFRLGKFSTRNSTYLTLVAGRKRWKRPRRSTSREKWAWITRICNPTF